MKYCPKCRKEIITRGRFCTECGGSLEIIASRFDQEKEKFKKDIKKPSSLILMGIIIGVIIVGTILIATLNFVGSSRGTLELNIHNSNYNGQTVAIYLESDHGNLDDITYISSGSMRQQIWELKPGEWKVRLDPQYGGQVVKTFYINSNELTIITLDVQ